jgi:hypothetical protein
VPDERMQILQMIEEKQISAEEGIKLLEALSSADESATEDVLSIEKETTSEAGRVEGEGPEETVAAPAPSLEPENLRQLWLIPLAAGGLSATIGLAITLLIQVASPGSFFLTCGLMPFLLGLAIIVLAFWSRTARWLYVRIRGEQRFTLGFPLPLRLTGWVLRLVRPYVPQLEETALDEVILSLNEGLTGEGGLYVDVQDDERGEHVQVFIG